MSAFTRRVFIASATTGVALLVGGRVLGSELTATKFGFFQAAQGTLNSLETATLVAWCDFLVPGAQRYGVDRFINDQLAKPHPEALLMMRYVDWPPPYQTFYKDGLAALNNGSRQMFGQPFAKLTQDQKGQVLGAVLSGTLPWAGPPPGLFYFITRSDAVDVVYGTPEGFQRIDFPYMPLIEPPSPW